MSKPDKCNHEYREKFYGWKCTKCGKIIPHSSSDRTRPK